MGPSSAERPEDFDSPKLKSIQIELQADCSPGSWSRSTWARSFLAPGEIAEAPRLGDNFGDPRGTPADDPYAHVGPSSAGQGGSGGATPAATSRNASFLAVAAAPRRRPGPRRRAMGHAGKLRIRRGGARPLVAATVMARFHGRRIRPGKPRPSAARGSSFTTWHRARRAPPPRDVAPANGIPDYVESVSRRRGSSSRVLRRAVPRHQDLPGLRGRPLRRRLDGRVDVYVRDPAASPAAHDPDSQPKEDRPRDLAEARRSGPGQRARLEGDGIRFTVAHEVFHLVQFHHVLAGMPRWIAEGTANTFAFFFEGADHRAKQQVDGWLRTPGEPLYSTNEMRQRRPGPPRRRLLVGDVRSRRGPVLRAARPVGLRWTGPRTGSRPSRRSFRRRALGRPPRLHDAGAGPCSSRTRSRRPFRGATSGRIRRCRRCRSASERRRRGGGRR